MPAELGHYRERGGKKEEGYGGRYGKENVIERKEGSRRTGGWRRRKRCEKMVEG